MPKLAKIILGLLFTLGVVGALGFAWWHRAVEAQRLQRQLREADQEAWVLADRGRALTAALAAAQARVAELEQRTAAAAEAQQSLEAQMRRALESRDVTISELQGRLTVDILDRVLFDTGEATLKPEGIEVLRQVAGVLAQVPQRPIHVIGHTDNVPIRPAARGPYASNWELSTARALAAVRFLTEQAGVDPRRVGAVGYGEYRPLADNATPEGRARNRRIAIVVMSEELVGLDAAPAATDAVPAAVVPPAEAITNAPPATANPSLGVPTNAPPAAG
jgi:chemotaxis protein MotB